MDYNTDYKEFYNTFPSSYFCSLPDGTIIDSNKNFLELTNYSREEIIGQKKITDFLSLGEKIYFESVFIPALKLSGTIAEVNFNFTKKGGTKFPVLLNSIEVKDVSGTHLYTHSAVFHISKRKKYEEELLTSKKNANELSNTLTAVNKELQSRVELLSKKKLQLEELNQCLENKNKQLSSFAHIASHNLRAPVNNLMVLSDLYKEKTGLKDKALVFSKVEKVIDGLNETLNDFIDSANI